MTPRISDGNMADIGPRHTDIHSNGALSNAFSEQLAYSENFFNREHGARMGFTSGTIPPDNVVGVSHVFGMSNPFKIAHAVVRFNPVFVVNFVSEWIRFKKRQSNETMRTALSLFSILYVQLVDHVSESIYMRLHDTEGDSSICRRVPSNPSKRAHRIHWKLSDCFPNLRRGIDLVRHAWPFFLRLRLFRRVQWLAGCWTRRHLVESYA